MREVRTIMGMPVIIEICDTEFPHTLFEEVFSYLQEVDEKFSTYKNTSEISKINNGSLKVEEYSEDMKIIFKLSEETKELTKGYFDIKTPEGKYDPSGIVKGWAIFNTSKILKSRNIENFYIEIAGDIQTCGVNKEGKEWSIGIQNPFNKKQEVIKTIYLGSRGVATSGTSIRGQHIYNPVTKESSIDDNVSLTVIGPNVYEADRFATAAFAMGKDGINFIEQLTGFEGYLIDTTGIATVTTGFEVLTRSN